MALPYPPTNHTYTLKIDLFRLSERLTELIMQTHFSCRYTQRSQLK
ncbi:hypothetical protein VDIAB_270518 [Vibrio diabolicus]|nr:hypothetical protein VDIAB_270518 [Vibrio diabolicus]